MTRGNIKYVPKEVIDELNKVKINLNINNDSEAFRRIIEDSRIGREIRFTIDFNTKRKK